MHTPSRFEINKSVRSHITATSFREKRGGRYKMSAHDKQQLDYLDQIALQFRSGNDGRGQQMFGVLSTGERCYVALAANRPDLLNTDDSIAYAIDRIGEDWVRELIARHRNDPRTHIKPIDG
jgi:hypothetical protein